MKYKAGIILRNPLTDTFLLGHITGSPSFLYTFPKGVIEKGETELQAALRETEEETGIDLTDYNISFSKKKTIKYKSGKQTLTLFLFETIKEEVYNFPFECKSFFECKKTGKFKPEIEWIDWFSLQDILNGKIKIHEAQMKCLKKMI